MRHSFKFSDVISFNHVFPCPSSTSIFFLLSFILKLPIMDKSIQQNLVQMLIFHVMNYPSQWNINRHGQSTLLANIHHCLTGNFRWDGTEKHRLMDVWRVVKVDTLLLGWNLHINHGGGRWHGLTAFFQPKVAVVVIPMHSSPGKYTRSLWLLRCIFFTLWSVSFE